MCSPTPRKTLIRWERGQLGWYDPATGRHILTYNDQRKRAVHAEARVRELGEQLRRQNP